MLPFRMMAIPSNHSFAVICPLLLKSKLRKACSSATYTTAYMVHTVYRGI